MIDLAVAKKQDNGTEAKAGTAEPRFSKEQIAASKRYCNQRDLVDALLEDGKRYAFAEVDGLIEKYRKGKVK